MRKYTVIVVILICIINFAFQFLVIPLIGGSQILKSVLSSVVIAGFLFVLLEIFRTMILKEIKVVESSMKEFSMGNFMSGITKSLRLKELIPMELLIHQTEEQMKNWIYHIIYSEVNLGDLAKRLQDNSKISLVSMKEISKNIDDMMTGSTKAANDSAENAAISEELLSSNTEIATYSSEAKNFALESVDSIKRDSMVISEALSNVDEIGTLMVESSVSISTLKQLLNSISSMASSISAIAEQTNLLSLNASIEAARAGEAGRGFGVVANEIKKLAEQSANTVSQINDNISSIEISIQDTVSIINRGKEKASSIRAVSNEATQNLHNIHEKIKGMMDLISNISVNVTEQNNATEALAKNIEDIASFTNETDKITKVIDVKAKEQVDHSEGNSKIASNIVHITDKFKSFIEPIENKLDVGLIEACKKLASVIAKGNINNDLLSRISKLSGITEIFITDENGVITYSNNIAAIGFEFKNEPSSQTYDFYRILGDPTLQVCQKMRVRDIDGKYFKIVGISRMDQKGVIQVGLSLEDIVQFKGFIESEK